MHTPSSFEHNDVNLHSIIQHVVHLAIPHYILVVACSLIAQSFARGYLQLGVKVRRYDAGTYFRPDRIA